MLLHPAEIARVPTTTSQGHGDSFHEKLRGNAQAWRAGLVDDDTTTE